MLFGFLKRKDTTEKETKQNDIVKTEESDRNNSSVPADCHHDTPVRKEVTSVKDNVNHSETGGERDNSAHSQQEQKIIPFDALARKNRTVIMDSSVLNSSSFNAFMNRNLASIQSKKYSLLVPKFELESLAPSKQEELNRFFDNSALKTVEGSVKDYSELVTKIGGANKEKGQLCFLVNDPKKKRSIIAAAKAGGVFVQIFSVNSAGELYQPAPRKDGQNDQNKEKKKDVFQNKEKKTQADRFVIADKPEKMRIVPIRLPKPVITGCTVFDSKNNPVSLTDQVIVNPNAVTYSTNVSGMWAKIYNPESLTTFLEEKAKRMLSKEVKYKGLCWPVDTLRDSAGNFVGLLVPPAKGEPLQISVFKQAGLQKYFPGWNKKDLCDLAITILRVIQYLHNMNILLGCINPAAIRVAGKNEVYFVDTDNYQIEGFPSLVYNTTFTPPELLDRKIYLCTKANENYAVAMMIFMLMMPGKTPYVIKKNQDVKQAIQEQNFAFPNGNIHGSHAMPGMWRFMWSHLTPFKDVFFNTFQKGGKFEAPEERRTVGNWIGTTLRFKEELENPSDPESLKIYPKTFKRGKNDTFYTCKYCGTEHPKFYFNKTYFDDYQICNSCIDKKSNVSFTCKACGRTFYYTNRTALFHDMKKKKDSEWKDQKYCSDCKKKTMPCADCGKVMPYYYLRNGRCHDCNERHRNSIYKSGLRCRDCGRTFSITVGEHEFAVQKGIKDPSRCESCREKKKNNRW